MNRTPTASLPRIAVVATGGTIAGAGTAPGDAASAAYRSAVVVVPVAPAAMTYYPPAIVITERPRKPYALVAAPTLPCAPAYCPRRVRVDRN